MTAGPDDRDHKAREGKSRSALFAAMLEDHYRQVLDLKFPDKIFGLARRLTLRGKDKRLVP